MSWSESISCACSSAWALEGSIGVPSVHPRCSYYCVDTKAMAQAFQEKISLLQTCDSKVTTSHSSLLPFFHKSHLPSNRSKYHINIKQSSNINPPTFLSIKSALVLSKAFALYEPPNFPDKHLLYSRQKARESYPEGRTPALE